MKEISLLNGGVTLVDEDDYEFLSQWAWRKNPQGYAIRTGKPSGGAQAPGVYILHQILCPAPKGLCTDHINRNRLDNRRSNLRATTRAENKKNSDYSGPRFRRCDVCGRRGILIRFRNGEECPCRYCKQSQNRTVESLILEADTADVILARLDRIEERLTHLEEK